MFIGKDLINDIQQKHPLLQLQSHSYALHQKINKVSKIATLTIDQMQKDVKNNNKILNSKFFCYPYGDYNDKFISVLKDNNYKMAFTYGPFKKATRSDDLFLVPRVEIAGTVDLNKFKEILYKKQ